MAISEPKITRMAAGHGGEHNRKIWAYVVHDEEFPERLDSAERVADYFATHSAGSAHYCGDPDSETHCVPERVMAYGVGGCNDGTIHFEQDGYAKQSRAEWLDTHSRATIARCAARGAAVCAKYGLPLEKRSTGQGEVRTPGIYGHRDLSAVSWVPSTHTDPGPWYPWDVFMSDVRRAAAWLDDEKSIRTFQILRGLVVDGDAGYNTIIALGSWLVEPFTPAKPDVKKPLVPNRPLETTSMNFTIPLIDFGNPAHSDEDLPGNYFGMGQACLALRGYYKGKLDRIPGPKSKTALEAFQRAHHLPATGRYDVATYRALTGAQ